MASSANASRTEPIKRIRIWESLLVLEISTLTLRTSLCQPPLGVNLRFHWPRLGGRRGSNCAWAISSKTNVSPGAPFVAKQRVGCRLACPPLALTPRTENPHPLRDSQRVRPPPWQHFRRFFRYGI